MRVGLISLEPWDEVWRRNQHFCAQLVDQQLAAHVLFVEPPRLSVRVPRTAAVRSGVTVISPTLRAPKRAGGLALLGALLRSALRDRVDVIWLNDPTFGAHCLVPGVPALYDVTDDWREFHFPKRIVDRLVRAEDRLARQAGTVVCSEVLSDRWAERYGSRPPVVHNGVDTASWSSTTPYRLEGPGPHVGYIGTLHDARLDLDLLVRLSQEQSIGQLHLVGPDALSESGRALLAAQPKIVLHGPVPSAEVSAWTTAMDVLISPHAVNAFTLSLDAIKSYEYLASSRAVVATPTSGFQVMRAEGLAVVPKEEFVQSVVRALDGPREVRREVRALDWAARAREFAEHLRHAVEVGR